MSHGDQVHDLPEQFIALATTPTCPYAAAKHRTRPFYGVQFHPEVTHTPRGDQIFQNFLYEICHCKGDWTMGNFVEHSVRLIREQVGLGKVICRTFRRVDSSVVAALLHKAIGDSSSASSSTTACSGKITRPGRIHLPRSLQNQPRHQRCQREFPWRIERHHRPAAEAESHWPRVHRGI